ncbi:response regulator transcription factor [Paraburkholderia kururiensis]|uniref:response regulator transcription factor n=1 Tax=Paraburkholderia kururiensis TaxID=984307 RepID=UPI0039A5E73C
MKILLVDDDVRNCEALHAFMRCMGHRVFRADDGNMALELMRSESVSLVLMDWLPRAARGAELLERMRCSAGPELGIVCLASRKMEMELLSTPEFLFDDYILKPFSGVDLTTRIDAWRRRHTPTECALPAIRVGDFELDLNEKTITLRSEPVCLTPKEFFLLTFMFHNVGKVLSRQIISVAAWGGSLNNVSRTIDTHIYRLRKKLGLCPENGVRLSSIYTLGYRLDEVRRNGMERELPGRSAPTASVDAGANPEGTALVLPSPLNLRDGRMSGTPHGSSAPSGTHIPEARSGSKLV